MSNSGLQVCPVCRLPLRQPAFETSYSATGGGQKIAFKIDCDACGKFYVTPQVVFADDSQYAGRRHVISAAIRRLAGKGEIVEVHSGNIQNYLFQVTPPSSLVDAMLEVLNYIDQRAPNFGSGVKFRFVGDHALFALKTPSELAYVLDQLVDAGLVELLQMTSNGIEKIYRIKSKGVERLLETRLPRRKGNVAFVARWFDNDGVMAAIERDAIFPALTESGYEMKSEAGEVHNGDITLSIIGSIQMSSLVIADFTGHRTSVYWEAGFARALGIEVIHCVKKDHASELAFDTRQIKHIVWTDADDLRGQLKSWIAATAPLFK